MSSASTVFRLRVATLCLLLTGLVSAAAQANSNPHLNQKKVSGSSNLNVLSLAGDTLFVTDSATLTAKGRQELDAVLKKNPTLIQMPMMISGHADNMGSKQYNRDLSFRRAEAVRTYFKSKGQFERIEVQGLGESKPLVSCAGVKPKEKLIKCLAPNRRVEIERMYGQ
jgi:outer membrane protein OmpA-like peptidoglycan-associated protein